MTIRFAAARRHECSAVSRVMTVRAPMSCANDNGWSFAHDTVLHDALRHFARDSLAAARTALDYAQAAQADGDEDGSNHWLAICRALDRRMASASRGRD